MTNTVVLARPHPFVVGEMAQFLAELKVTPKRAESLDDIAPMLTGAKGVVISTAVTSTIPEDAEAVYEHVRSLNPTVPIIFAGLLPLERSIKSLLHIQRHEPSATGVAGSLTEHGTPRFGTAGTFVYFSKDDLNQADTRAAAISIVRKHFKL